MCFESHHSSSFLCLHPLESLNPTTRTHTHTTSLLLLLLIIIIINLTSTHHHPSPYPLPLLAHHHHTISPTLCTAHDARLPRHIPPPPTYVTAIAPQATGAHIHCLSIIHSPPFRVCERRTWHRESGGGTPVSQSAGRSVGSIFCSVGDRRADRGDGMGGVQDA